MTNILLAALVAAFVLAFAAELFRKRRSGQGSWLRRFLDDVRRGFMEGYRGEASGSPVPPPAV